MGLANRWDFNARVWLHFMSSSCTCALFLFVFRLSPIGALVHYLKNGNTWFVTSALGSGKYLLLAVERSIQTGVSGWRWYYRLLVCAKSSASSILGFEGCYLQQIPEFLSTHDLYFGFIQHFFCPLRAPAAETASSYHMAVSAEPGVWNGNTAKCLWLVFRTAFQLPVSLRKQKQCEKQEIQIKERL